MLQCDWCAMCTSRGFSLVETIIAIALLTGALMTFAQLLATSVHTTAAGRYRTVATLIAQQRIEQLRSEATLADAVAIEHFDGSGQRLCDTAEVCAGSVFTARWSVTPFVSAPGAVLIEVAVSHAHRNYGVMRSFAIRPRSVR